MTKLKLYAALVLIFFVLILVFQNRAMVDVKCLFMTITMPRAALLAVTMLIGVAVGVLLSLSIFRHHAKKE